MDRIYVLKYSLEPIIWFRIPTLPHIRYVILSKRLNVSASVSSSANEGNTVSTSWDYYRLNQLMYVKNLEQCHAQSNHQTHSDSHYQQHPCIDKKVKIGSHRAKIKTGLSSPRKNIGMDFSISCFPRLTPAV